MPTSLPSNPQADSGPEPSQPLKGYEIIRQHFLDFYRPAFRRGPVMYSAAQGREVKIGEATSGADSQLIGRLAAASDAPRDAHGQVKFHSLPSFFHNWSKTAWMDVMKGLPDANSAPVRDEGAANEFRRVVTKAFLTQVPLGVAVINPVTKRMETQTQRRALIDWAWHFAREGVWKQVYSYRYWTKLDKQTGGEVILRVAVRYEFFDNLGVDLKVIGKGGAEFNGKAAQYGVGRTQPDERPHGQWAVILNQEFLDGLTSSPALDHFEGETAPKAA